MAIIIHAPSGTMGFSTMQNGIYHLKGIIKHYDWGGFSFIPSLIRLANSGNRPFAEYWMGIHPLGDSLVEVNGEEKKLSEIVPELSYLFKVLDVRDMLSIQVHPTKEGAEAGFEQENKEGIPLDSPFRNYKDRNHKPELMVALSDFWLLHGFKPEKELEFTLLNVVELRELLPVYNHGGYKELYRHVMEMPQEEVNRILQPLISNLHEVYSGNEPDKDDEDFWVVRAAKLFCPPGHIDRGIFSIFLLNLLHLKKGEAVFQAAGVPHAYLEGRNIEIMANSDNVLRGGLTNKHIAVEELLKHVRCEPFIPAILTLPDDHEQEKFYDVPVTDFQLYVIRLTEGEKQEYISQGPEILLITEGKVMVNSASQQLALEAGQPSVLILPRTSVMIKAYGQAMLFRATTGKK